MIAHIRICHAPENWVIAAEKKFTSKNESAIINLAIRFFYLRRKIFMAGRDKIIFMPLGGAQEVGASCYYLKLGEHNFLLDCGTGQNNGVIFSPKFNAPVEASYIQDLHQISHVFISHAHLDHVAALPYFLELNERATVYMTDFTFRITELQLEQKLSLSMKQNISRVGFLQEIPIDNLSVSFHQAGHIPGAMMTLFNFGGRKILYTGDYSTSATQLSAPAIFPDEEIDVLIICAVHARHSMHEKNHDAVRKILSKISQSIKRKRKVYCHVNQISKGVELIALVSQYLPYTEIFIDERVMKTVRCFEEQHVPIMTVNTHPLTSTLKAPCVIFSTFPPQHLYHTDFVNCNFSLHDDFQSVVNLVERVNPKICVVVHSPPDKKFYRTTIEQVIMKNPDSQTSFIFPELCQPFEI